MKAGKILRRETGGNDTRRGGKREGEGGQGKKNKGSSNRLLSGRKNEQH